MTPSPAMSTATPLAPTRPSERIVSMDIARGLALFGIFMVNIQLMTQPLGTMHQGVGAHPGVLAQAMHLATRVLFEAKSYPLFSLLFGMGLVLMRDRAKAKGRVFAWPAMRRLVLLAGMGLVHAWLFWYGDVLFYYATLGLVVMWLTSLKTKTMLWLAGILVAMATAMSVGIGVMFAAMSALDASNMPAAPVTHIAPVTETQAAGFVGFIDGMASGSMSSGPEGQAWMAAELDAFKQGPYGHAVAMRMINWLAGAIFWWVINGAMLHIAGMFFLGGALVRSGVLTDPAWAKRFMRMGLFVGLPLSMALVAVAESQGVASPAAAMAMGLIFLVGPLVSLGYLGFAMWLANTHAKGWLARLTAAAGRMALTNYLMQTLLIAALAQHWGLAWFGDVSRLQMVGLVVGIYAMQLLVSTLWLSRFNMGPLESLWRCGTYLKWPRSRSATA